MKTPKAVLQEARALIEKGWVKGAFAVNKAGHGVETNDPTASCFCLSGAMWKAADSQGASFGGRAPTEWETARGFVLEAINGKDVKVSVVRFNDDPATKKKDVLRVLDVAIEKASEAGK